MEDAHRELDDNGPRPYRAQRDGRKLRTKAGGVRKFASLKAACAALRKTRKA